MQTVTIAIDGLQRPVPANIEGTTLYRLAVGGDGTTAPVLVQKVGGKELLVPNNHSPYPIANGDVFESRQTFDQVANTIQNVIAEVTAPLQEQINELKAQVAALTAPKK